MTRDEAIEVTQMLLNSWVRPEWTDGQTEMFVNALHDYDAEVAVGALSRAYKTISYRPTFAEFVAFYRAHRADIEQERERERMRNSPGKPEPSPGSRKLPPWVKEWFAARYAYHRFDRPQDMRRFAQQGDWANPDTPLMPPNEWAREAQALSDTEIKKGIANGGQRTPARHPAETTTMGAGRRPAATDRNGNTR